MTDDIVAEDLPAETAPVPQTEVVQDDVEAKKTNDDGAVVATEEKGDETTIKE